MDLLTIFFTHVYIPIAVWEEITFHTETPHYEQIVSFFEAKIFEVKGINHLRFVMDYGESEAVLLYQELSANFLLIDDKKGRTFAENLGINCIGTLGLLISAKSEHYIKELRPLFLSLLENDRYYSVSLLNSILSKSGEDKI